MISLPFLTSLILLSIVCGVFSDGFSLSDRKQKMFFLFTLMILSIVIVLVTNFVFGALNTRYELLLVNAIVAVAFSNLYVPLRIEKRLSVVRILKVACLVCVAVVIYSILTIGQVLIHGDTATASILTKCQVDHRSYFPETWYYVNGDIWVFTLQNFVAPCVLLLKDQSLARTLGSALLCVVTSFTMAYHSKKRFSTNCWVIAVPLTFLFLAGQYDMILYQAAYTTQMIFLILGAVFFYDVAICPNNWKSHFLYAIFSVIALMGGIRYLAEVIVPLCGTYVIFVYFRLRDQKTVDWKYEIRNLIRVALEVLIPTILGIVLYWWLKNTHNVISSAHNMLVYTHSVQQMIENIFKYISNLFICFGFTGHISVFSIQGIMNMVSICMCGLVVFIVPILQLIKIKNESSYVQFFSWFTLVHNLIIMVLAVCFVGKDESRYLLTSIFLSILLSSRYIYEYWICQKHFDKFLWTGLFVLAISIGLISLLLTSVGWQSELRYKEAITEQLQEKGLKKGYADFWIAYANEVYSDFNIRFGGIEIYDGIPYKHFWLVDGDVFKEEDLHTFLMLTEEQHSVMQSKMTELFREPIDYLNINGYHIYIFDYDIVVDIT